MPALSTADQLVVLRISVKIISLAVVLCALAMGCGGKPQSSGESEMVVETRNEKTYGLNPLYLSEHRYFDEMIEEETEEAYRQQRGDYIDPRRVVELLQEEREEPVVEQVSAREESEPSISWRISYLAHREAQKQFEDGHVTRAAAEWQKLLTDEQAFTLSVEVDCDVAILRRSYSLLLALDAPVFLESVEVGGKGCYRICVGVFPRRAEASEWIDQVKSRLPDSHPFVYVISKTKQ